MSFLRFFAPNLRRSFCTIPPYKKNCVPYSETSSSFTYTCNFAGLPTAIPSFRLIDLKGNYLGSSELLPALKEIMPKIYEIMLKSDQIDQILLMAQRQGRLPFYMASFGETASTVASAAALENKDLMFLQYREQGAMLWRGMSIKNMMDQCYGNIDDIGKGRQMPMHFCVTKEKNIFSISSPLSKYKK